MFATNGGYTAIVDLLVKNGGKAIVTSAVKATWLRAAENADLKTIRELIDRYDKSILELKNVSVKLLS